MALPNGPDFSADNQQASQKAMDLPGLVHEHHAAVYRYASRLCGCAVEAEDLTQQTFLIAHQRIEQLREPAAARGWLLAVARSCFLKSLRHRRARPAEDVWFDVQEVADRTPAVSEVDSEAVHLAVGQLPDEFRLVLLMFYFEELSYQQIAEQLNLPMGTVMSRLSRAKRHLREKLAPPGEPLRTNYVPPAIAPSFVTSSSMRAAPTSP